MRVKCKIENVLDIGGTFGYDNKCKRKILGG